MKLKTEWELKDVFKSREEVNLAVEKYKSLKEKFIDFKGRLNNRESILEYYETLEEFAFVQEKLYCYIKLLRSLSGKDEYPRKLESELEAFNNKVDPKLAFIEEEMSKNSDEFLNSLAAEKEFKDFDLSLKEIIRLKPHIVPENIEAVLSMNPAFGTNGDVFDNFNDIDLKFKSVKTASGLKKLTHASYIDFIHSPDDKVRRAAYDNYHKAYADFNYTLGSLYLNDVKETIFSSKVEKFNSTLENSCFSDHTEPEVLKTLIEVVHSNLKLFYKYEELLKRALKKDKLFYYDMYLELGEVKTKFSYEKSCEIVLDALSVLGEDYKTNLRRAMEGGWIDVYERPFKESGAYSLSLYGVHPFVLLNHTDNYSGLTTIAHELGHAMHGYYTNKTQPITKSDASIFACEVASLVNEMILIRYLINKAKDKKEKLFYVTRLLQNFYSTLFRQTMFAEFEDYVFSSLEADKPVLVEDLNNKYCELQSLYFGSGAKATKYSKFEWSRVPHFYRPYYVYKYSTGFISACTIAKKILSGDEKYIKKYIDYLKAGDSVDPLTLLKSVDVDLTKKESMSGAFEFYEWLIGEFESLI